MVAATELKLTDATISSIGITLNNPVAGAGGQINSLATGVNGVVGNYFTADMLGGAVNNISSASITLTGLTQGNDVLYALGARGNNYAGNTNQTTYTLTAGEGTTVSNVKASILDDAVASGGNAPTLNDTATSVTGATYGDNNQATNRVLVSFSFGVLSGGERSPSRETATRAILPHLLRFRSPAPLFSVCWLSPDWRDAVDAGDVVVSMPWVSQ